MANHALLNNVHHRDLKINTALSADFGDNLMCTLAIPAEFRNLVADYTILIHKDADSGRYLPMVMFGFEHSENLFLSDTEWQSDYLPLMMRRGPFFIGFQNQDKIDQQNMVVLVDMDSPRLTDEGTSLFTSFGENTEYLEEIVSVMQAVHEGQADIERMSEALVKYDLLEQFTLEVELNNGEQHRLEGFYTVPEEKLLALGEESLVELNKSGVLSAAYMMVASMANLPALIRRKNQTVGA